jgi:hypothetical protein
MVQGEATVIGKDRTTGAMKWDTPIGIAVAALLLGCLGWILPSVGGSLVVPTLIVFGTGAVVAVAVWVVGRRRNQRLKLSGLAIGVALVTVLASVWTLEFSLPVALWLSNATSQAQAALAPLRSAALDHQGVAPSRGCSSHTAGSIGPLNAPYEECPIWTPEGHFVTFAPVGLQGGGLGYTNAGASTFPDKCVRQLTGPWWMFTNADLDNPASPCHFGYTFQGGG